MNPHNYKPGEMIEIKHLENHPWKTLKFIGVHSNGEVVCESAAMPGACSMASIHRPIPQKKTRMMTAKELAGMWVSEDIYNGVAYCVGAYSCHDNTVCFVISPEGRWSKIREDWRYTTTPADDASWKSVMIEEEA